MAAMPKLAALVGKDGVLPFLKMETATRGLSQMGSFDEKLVLEPIVRRVLNANFRLGEPGNAERLAAFAANGSNTESMRREAVRLLSDWPQPSPRDHVVGAWRPLTPSMRDTSPVRPALTKHLAGMLVGGDGLRAMATKLAGSLGLNLDGATLLGWVTDPTSSSEARISALEMLASSNSPQLDAALGSVLNASANPPGVYGAGLKLLAAQHPEDAARQLDFPVRYRLTQHAQQAFAALASTVSTNLDQRLERYLADVSSGSFPKELQLDVVVAAGSRPDSAVKSALAKVTNSLAGDPLGIRKLALAGGNAARGRKVFFGKAETECLRCHKVTVEGQLVGGDAAPNLTGLGQRSTREQITTSILKPNDTFAPGYEQVALTLKDGSNLVGRVIEENQESLLVEIPVASDEEAAEAASAGAKPERRSVAKSTITQRERGLSGMPEGLGEALSAFELRDLLEFLAGQ